MARLSRLHLGLFLIVIISFSIGVLHAGGEGSLLLEECPGACDYRCSETHHPKPCLFYCNQCCDKCLCVPSGTFGNKEECPCYNNWKTKEGGPKCP